MESKKINQLATELSPVLSDLTIIGDPSTGISKKITLSQMASLFTGTVEEYPNLASFPLVGTADTIYIALDTNVLYRWNTGTNAYVELSPNIINSLVFSDANGFDGTISLVGSTATLTITTALTTGSVPFIGASGALTQDNSNLFFDDTNNRLGINTNAPTTALDVFGSGIIGRLNGTSTNNAFLGFANAGTNRWSIGNVQSDHRFRIYSETNTSELLTVLQTGEFGIGIANPTTKFHIDGGASALIANLDANVSVAKSVSFRSDNSNRINLEVSGTESGSNAGANFFLRTYTDLGALIETPFQIVRSTGVTTIKSLTLTNALSVANGGTGSTTQNFVDLTTTQTVGGAKTLSNSLTLGESITIGTGGSYVAGSIYSDSGWGMLFRAKQASPTNAQFRWSNSADTEFMRISPSGGLLVGTTPDGGFKLDIGGTSRFSGAATFSSSISATQVSIGTTSPATFLHVNGATAALPNGSGTTQSAGNRIRLSTAAGTGILDIGCAGGTGMWLQSTDLTDLSLKYPLLLNPNGGNVGVGTSSPTSFASTTLQVNGSGASASIKLTNTTTGAGNLNGLDILQSTTDTYFFNRTDGFMAFGTNNSERMRITSGGDVAINNTFGVSSKLKVKSDGTTSGTYACFFTDSNAADLMYVRSDGYGYLKASAWVYGSDLRIKENISNVENGLEMVLKMKPKHFDYIDGIKNNIGFIAQDIQEIIPEAVSEINNDGQLGLKTDFLVPYLVKAIQELKEEIDILKNK